MQNDNVNHQSYYNNGKVEVIYAMKWQSVKAYF